MAGIGDVVRHIILRITVDQAGFADDIAKARQKLKDLEGAERDSNTARAKDAEKVTKAVQGQTKAVEDNIDAVERHKRASADDASKTADQWRESTKSVKENTATQVAGAKAVEDAANQANKRQIERDNADAKRLTDHEKSLNESNARISRAQQKLNQDLAAAQHKINDDEAVRDATHFEQMRTRLVELTELQKKYKAESGSAQNFASESGSLADVAASRADDASDAFAQNAMDRRKRSLRDERRAREEINNVTRAGNVLEQRAAEIEERRVRSAQSSLAAVRNRRGLAGAAQNLGEATVDAATIAARSVSSGPQSFRRAGREFDALSAANDLKGLTRETEQTRRAASGLETGIARVFNIFKRDGDASLRTVSRLRAQFTALFEDLARARQGGGGGNLFGNLFDATAEGLSNLAGTFNGLGKRFFSFRTLIVAAIAALGPLAAILGGIGGAALGLASNLVSLSGSLLALPGIVGAGVAAFGALALVIKPLSGVFSAYSAAQKEATDITKQGTSAALDYKEALLSQQEAELAHSRAVQDVPRAQSKLNDARKQAARDIQDYRLQLQKLKFDEEGAKLGVLSAEQDYRRALADPTASVLDRQIAKHSVEGSLFDQRDQQVAGSRLQQDSSEAFKKGVEGSDEVIDAERGVEDATNDVTASYIAWQKAILEVQKAAKVKAAGGTAAAQLQAELDKLPPKTRLVAQALLDLQKPYKAMRDRLSENIFGPISADTGKFTDLLKSLESFLGPASVSIGELAQSALTLFTNPDWKAFFKSQGTENGYIIKQLGDAALSAADGFRAIVEQARPFTRFIVDGIKGMASAFQSFATSDAGRDKVSAFLALTRRRMQELYPVVKNIISGLAGFFAALNTAGGGKSDFTTYLNKGLLTASETFKKLGDQARNPNSGFQKWLRDVRPLLHDIVGFLSSAGKFIGNLFSDNDNMAEASKLLQQISQKWLPALAEIFDKLSQSGLISKLATGISAIFDGVNKFFDAGGLGAISSFADKLIITGKIIDGLITGLSKIPGALQLIAGAAALALGVAFVGRFTGIFAIVKGLIGALVSVRNIANSIKNPANSVATPDGSGSTQQGGKKPSQYGSVGPTGRAGSSASTGGGVGKKPKKKSKVGQALGSIFNKAKQSKAGQAVGSVATGAKQSKVGQVATGIVNRGKPVAQGVAGAAKDALTGDQQQLPVLRRSELYLKQIEINTRRYGSGGGSGGSGSSGGGGSRPNRRPTGGSDVGSSAPNRRSLPNFANATVRDELRETIDPGVTTRRSQGTSVASTRANSAEPARVGSTTPIAGSTFADQQRADYDSRVAQREDERNQRNSPAGRQTRLDNVADAAGRRSSGQAIVPSLDYIPEVAEPTALDEQPNNRRSSSTETGAQKRKRLARERAAARNEQVTSRRQASLAPADEPDVEPTPAKQPKRKTLPGTPDRHSDVSGTPIADVGDDRTPYRNVGVDEPYTVPTASEVKGQKAPTFKDSDGRFVSPYAGANRDLAVPEPGFARGGVPAKQTPRRNAQTRTAGGQFGARKTPHPVGSGLPSTPILADAGDDRSVYTQPARRSLKDRLFPSGDEGSFGGFGLFGNDTDEATPTSARRSRTTRPGNKPTTKSRFGRLFGRGRGKAGAAAGGVASILGDVLGGGGGVGGDAEYEQGYEDGLAASSGGSGGSGSKSGRRGTALEGEVVDEDEATRSSRRGLGLPEEEPTAGRRGTVIDGEARETARGKPTSRLGRLLGRGRETSAITSEVETLARSGGKLGGIARLGGGLAKGLAGGIGGLVLGGAAQLGGDYLLNKYVKNDSDKSSLQRGLGAVSTGAGIGATIGSIIPGVGTVIGGAVGGLAGGAYSLFKDKNLRNFVGDKLGGVGSAIGGAAKGVGGFLSGAGSAIGGAFSGLFGGGKKDDAKGGGFSLKGAGIGALLGGPVGAILGGTDIGKSILDSLKKAGGGISKFFTKDIPDQFHRGIKAITDFFTKTLPGLPRKAVQGFIFALGEIVGFFQYTIPRAAEKAWHGITTFFTKTLPRAASAAWQGITGFFTQTLPNVAAAAWNGITGFFTETLPAVASAAWHGITGFFTETLPHVASAAWSTITTFFTKTLPSAAQTAWDGITGFFTTTLPQVFDTVVGSISTFFSTTLPNFFTKTLPDAISQVPDMVKSAIVDPVVSFFSGIKDHIGDVVKGSWDWVTGLFSGAGKAFNAGKATQKGHMSGGLIAGVYQGIEDKVSILATPGEFYVRKSVVDKPGAKAFLTDFNEGRFDPSSLYSGLSATTAPQVMSMVPPEAQGMTRGVPTIVNNTVNHAPVMGDVTINNPVRERSERSLRRQVQIANIRHRR